MSAIQQQANALLNWFLDFRSIHIDREGEHRSHAIAQVISAMYGALQEQSAATAVEIRRPVISTTAYAVHDADYRQGVVDFIVSCQQVLPEFCRALYLHGSLATLDYSKGWSDVDTFMVVKASTILNPNALVELRRQTLKMWPRFLAVCPLQHHGFITVAEQDLLSYRQSFLPLPVFAQALSLWPSAPLSIHLAAKKEDGGSLRGLQGRRQVLDAALVSGDYKHHPHNGVYLRQKFENADEAMPQMFAFLGWIMTLPAYVAEAIGQGCYKAESFAKMRPQFSQEGWSLIERASRIRREWQEREWPLYAGTAIPLWVQSMLGSDYLKAFSVTLDEAMSIAGKHARI